MIHHLRDPAVVCGYRRIFVWEPLQCVVCTCGDGNGDVSSSFAGVWPLLY